MIRSRRNGPATLPGRSALISLGAAVVLAVSGAVAAFAPQAASAATTSAGSYVPVHAARVVDTRSGRGGHHGALRAHRTMATRIGGHAHVPARGVAAVAVTLTVLSPTGSGSLVAWARGTRRPATVNVGFTRNSAAADLAVVPVSRTGWIDLYNDSRGTVQVVADVTGYYTAGSAGQPGSYRPVRASRVVDTRTGRLANGKGRLHAGRSISPRIAGHAGVPTSAGAVVVTISVMSPTRTGQLLAYPWRGARPSDAAVQFAARTSLTSTLAVVPLNGGRITLTNASRGSLYVAVDVSGYLLPGVPATSGALVPLTTQRVLDTRSGIAGNRKGALRAGRSASVRVGGKAGVPVNAVAAVLSVAALSPRAAGVLVVWPAGTRRPHATNVQFAPGRTTSNTVIVPLSAGGRVDVYNGSRRAVNVTAAVTGYVLTRSIHPPAASVGRYVRNLTGAASDAAIMHAEGAADAASGSRLVLLHIGAQLNDKTGVLLSATKRTLSYDQLTAALDGYLAGLGARSGVTVAVATNNDADDWTTYPASARGSDWANRVIDELTPGAGVRVVGASDIEPGFFSTQAQAQQWEAAFLAAATTKELIFAGSADGCPTRFGATGGTCNWGWTEAQLNTLAGGRDSRIQALPQIYTSAQAAQWANIYATGGHRIVFAGALTEHAAVPGQLTPQQGWARLYLALRSVQSGARLPAVVDLRIDA
jgi:hypothetical protein